MFHAREINAAGFAGRPIALRQILCAIGGHNIKDVEYKEALEILDLNI